MPSPRPPRKKVCTRCRIAKTRCCLTLPKCARCRSKGLICQYQSMPFHQSESANKSAEAVPIESAPESFHQRLDLSRYLETSATPSYEDERLIRQQHNSYSNAAWEVESNQMHEMNESTISHLGLSSTGYMDNQPWELLKAMNSDLDVSNIEYEEPSEKSQDLGWIHNDWQAQCYPQARPAALELNRPSPAELSTVQDPSELLAPKTLVSANSWLLARMLIGCISSYPYMIQDSSVLPPFIHPVFMQDDGTLVWVHQHGKPKLPQALANCASVVQIYRTGANTAFAERIILIEQQRFFDGCKSYNRWEALYALQACTIYLILIAFPKADKHKNNPRQTDSISLALALLSTITCLLSLHHSRDGQNLLDFDDHTKWHEWIWEESAKRVTGLLFMIGLLVNLSVGKKANTTCPGFGAICLPAIESLWEASTQSEWEERLRLLSATRRSNAVLTVATLEDTLCRKQQMASGTILSDLGDWCEAVDRFGRLVIMAVTMKGD